MPSRREVSIIAGEIGTVGGMEQVNARLVLGLLERGCSVTVFARRCELSPHPGLSWVRVRGIDRPFVLAYLSFFLFGSIAVRRGRRGVLHTTGAVVLNRADVSTVHFLHQAFDVNERLEGRDLGVIHRTGIRIGAVASRLAERLIYRPSRTRELVTVSSGLGREIVRHLPGASPVTVIPNGVDREQFRPDGRQREAVRDRIGLADTALVAVFVGGDWRRKGLHFAVEALRWAPEWHLVVVGRGDADEFASMGGGPELGGRLHFVGVHPDPAPFYAAADAFILPTGYEAFSLATFEAAAEGLPLLVTRVHGVDELLVDGANGWFIRRDAAEIADRLCRLGADAGLRERLGAAAREASASYDWSHVIDEHLRLYGKLSKVSTDTGSVQSMDARDLLRRLVAKVAPSFLPDRARRYERDLRARLGVTALGFRLAGATGGVVQAGPVSGLRYPPHRIADVDAPVAKLAGVYESELEPVLCDAMAGGVGTFIDIGCADGYYAVGLAAAEPQLRVFAWDISSSARALCAELASLNAVEDRVVIGGKFTLAALRRVAPDGGLVLVDIEGGEEDLLDRNAATQLARHRVIVEVHEDLRPGIQQRLIDAFSQTHDAAVIAQQPIDVNQVRILSDWTPEERELGLREFRGARNHWVDLTPKVAKSP